MATFLARMLGLDPVAENPFTDVVTGSTHAGNINAVRTVGITFGCDGTGTLFCPDDIVHAGTDGIVHHQSAQYHLIRANYDHRGSGSC